MMLPKMGDRPRDKCIARTHRLERRWIFRLKSGTRHVTLSTSQATETTRHSLDAFFADSLRKYPDRVALFAAGHYWSYGQLDAECKALEITLETLGMSQ